MNISAAQQKVKTILEPWAVLVGSGEKILDYTLTVEKFLPAMRAMREEKWGYLSAITGVDHPPVQKNGDGDHDGEQEGTIEVIYHFCEGAAIVNLRVYLPYGNPVIDTVHSVFPYANLYEREVTEMFGVQMKGIPNSDHLLLPDEWPEGVYPLRKSFTGLEDASAV